MKNFSQYLKRVVSVLLIAMLIVSLVPINAWAYVDYDEETVTLSIFEAKSLTYSCWNCSYFKRLINDGDWDEWPDPNDFDDYFCDECGLCWDCAREHAHCQSCGECIYGTTEGEDYCKECKRCRSCWTEDEHCPNCHRHDEERCTQCGWNMCYVCHDKHNAWCEYCGACMYAAYDNGTMCADGDWHCQNCCIVCEDCDKCFAIDARTADPGEFCTNCGLCIDCGVEDEQHCPRCRICFQDNDRCEGSELCIECCVDAGNHCPDCHKHIGEDGEWCPTNPDAHCLDCADLCPGCDECLICMDVTPCEDCGMCPECCKSNSESYGCDCGICVESGDFDDPEHRCERCMDAFSCVEEFCEDCGLCLDCCLAVSEEAGCVCGLCVESAEFEDTSEHMCPNCDGFTCVNGELCDLCGFCEVCCLDASEIEGCECGICVEDPDFVAPEHRCENCETNFSCVVDFCGDCGYCTDCCISESEQLGCFHEVCVQSSAWKDHYCEECGRCKEDCDCGQPCCEITPYSYERSTTAVFGSILSQPRNTGAYVSDGRNDDYLHTNRVSFYVGVFGDPSELYYQWYRKDGADGKPEKLTDETAGDEEYWGRNDAITSGAQSSTLTTYVPSDACEKEYCYYCEITDRDGNLLSRTREASLRARHRYEWVQADGGHIYRCVGCGALGKFADEVREHEFAERQILTYPTATEPGLLGHVCRVCGYEDGEVIAPLGRHDRHIFQYYSTSSEHWCECVCGKKINARSEHSWGDWILDKEATEKSRGSKHRVCLVCGYRQDAKIAKKLHAHGSFYSGDEYDHSFRKLNVRQHGRICDDPECGQWYDIEPHTFDEWEITAFPDWYTEGSMQRVCTGCGFTQVKNLPKMGEERRRVIVVEHGKSSKYVSCCRFEDTPILTADERAGYVFECWNCDLVYRTDKDDLLHVQNIDLMTPQHAGYTGRTDVIKVDDPNAEAMTVLDIPVSLNTLNPIYAPKSETECYFSFTPVYERLPLTVAIWPEDSRDRSDRVVLSPGEGYDCSTQTVRSSRTGTHLFLEEIETGEAGVDYPYEFILHMNGYEGGPIEILSPDPSAQLNCIASISIEDYESVIRSIAGLDYGIYVHCLNGGELNMYSENGGKLSIDVEGSRSFDVCGIDVQDEIGRTSLFLNNADLDIVSINPKKPLSRVEQSAVGINAKDVRIWGGNISIEAHAPYLDNEYAAIGINAESSIDIDSPALYIDVTDVDSSAGGTGAGLNAKRVDISMNTAKLLSDWYADEDADLMAEDLNVDSYDAGIFIDYPESGFAVKLPQEDPAGMAAITTYGESEEGNKTYAHCLGYTVQVDYDPDKVTLSPVGRVYVDEMGRFCVPAGEALEFVAAAELGYRGNNIGLYKDGKTYILPTIDENENRRYRIEHVTECMELTLGGVQPVEPFASDPLPSTQTVLGGGEGTAAVIWEMNAYEVQKLYKKNSGKQTANGTLEKHSEEEIFKPDTAYSAGVWLQSYNNATGRWINRPELGTFQASMHGLAEFTEERQYSRPGTTTQYRLTVLFDGLHYYSEPFEIEWTADESKVSARAASAVELYMTNAWNSNGEHTIYDGKDSGTWMRLDARYPDIYYDTVNGIYTNEYNRTRKVPEEGYVRFAHFDAGKGILTLDGDPDVWNPSLHEIRTAEGSNGDLTVYAAANCAIEQNTETVGWIDQWGDGKLVHFADSAAILNDTGSVILTGEPGAHLTIRAFGPYAMVREEQPNGSYYYTGEKISAVCASGDIRTIGAIDLEIHADCIKETDPKPGYYGCAAALDAKGNILIGGDTVLWISAGMGGGTRAGAAQAMIAEGHIRMEDNCSVEIQTYSEESASLYCNKLGSVWSEKTVTVDGNASVRISSIGKELCGIYAAESAYICSDRAAYINTYPESDEIETSAVIAPRTVVNGFHSFTWSDPDSEGPTTGELVLGDENTYVTYVSEPDWMDSRTFVVMDGIPRSLEIIAGGLSTDETKIEITRGGDTAEVFGKEFPVCPGDTVTLYPPEGLPGSVFARWGWPQYSPRDIQDMGGGAIRFTMPDWNITPIAVFDTSVVSGFSFTLDDSDPAMIGDHRIGKADIAFDVEIPADLAAGTKVDAYAVLECTYINEDGELVWCDRDTEPANTYSYLSHGDVVYNKGKGVVSFSVDDTLYLADVVPTELTPGEWVRIFESPDRSYRLRIMLYTVETVAGTERYTESCTLTTNPFELSWDKPFTVGVDGEGRNPELVIPSGDVGTSFALDFSKYVSGGSGQYHYSIVPAAEAVPMEFTFDEYRGTFCFFHTEDSVGMNYTNNCVQVTDVITEDMELIYFDVLPTLDTRMYDTYVGGVHVSEYNRDDVLGDGSVSYTPAEGGEPARLTLKGARLSSGFCGELDPANPGDNAFAAVFTREDLDIVVEGTNLITLDKNSAASGDPYVEDSLIAGICGFGADITLSGSGELYVRSDYGFCLAEDAGLGGGSLSQNGCALNMRVDKGNVFGKSGNEGFTYAGGKFSALSGKASDVSLLDGITFADGAQETAMLLLTTSAESGNAHLGSWDMLASQAPGSLYHYIRIERADQLDEDPTVLNLVDEGSGEIYVGLDKSAKGVSMMRAIVAIYEKDTERFLGLWTGEIDPSDPFADTGLVYDETKSYRIMLVEGEELYPLIEDKGF
ncbi:MAG: hypothetical protein K5981_08900 [Clostridia bacterium]|nr:hypothetical protein [Clostridia bacterium]